MLCYLLSMSHFSSFNLRKNTFIVDKNIFVSFLECPEQSRLHCWRDTSQHFTKLLSNTIAAFYGALGSFCQYNLRCMVARPTNLPDRTGGREPRETRAGLGGGLMQISNCPWPRRGNSVPRESFEL